MIVRVFLLIAVLVAVLYLVDAYKQLQKASKDELRGGKRPGSVRPGKASGSRLVACEVCGVHVPASRALQATVAERPATFCSPACRRAAEER
jgi:hypothetical protein